MWCSSMQKHGVNNTAATCSTGTGFNDIIGNFVRTVEGLHRSLFVIMTFVQHFDKTNKNELNLFLDKYGKKEKDDDGDYHTIPLEFMKEAIAHEKNASGSRIALDFVPKSFIVLLVSQYDAYLGNLIKALLGLFPEVLFSSDRVVKFSKIAKSDSISAVVEEIIEKEVETVLRKSHVEQFAWMQKIFEVPLNKDVDGWEGFVEVTERRNLFVHCDGVVSKQYLVNCKDNNVKFEDGVKLGEKLSVSPEYFHEAYCCIFKVGYILGQVLWRRFVKEENKKADENIITTMFDSLLNEDYKLVISIGLFALKYAKFSEEEGKRVVVINLAIAYKMDGQDFEKNQLINKWDWSACGPKFKMAISVLQDKFEEASEIMEKIGNNGDIKKHDYITWPLFTEYRKSELFKTTYEKVFNEKYIEYEVRNETAVNDKSRNKSREAGKHRKKTKKR